MAKKKKVNLTELAIEDLHDRLDETTARLQQLRFSHVVTGLDNPNILKQTRKEIARLKTEIRAREIVAVKNEKA